MKKSLPVLGRRPRTLSALLATALLLFFATALNAQITVSGVVMDAETGETLVGANILVEGTQMGTATNIDGEFVLENVPQNAKITASMVGYKPQTKAASPHMTFELEAGTLELTTLEIVASRADRETPFAFTNLGKKEVTERLGSQDLPMVLNTAPSVYATTQGGGAGDARINVRGFNQRNVAIMINGVPVNDMENGWVYWSNWDGVGDATSSIQLQRGLSSVNLATPSIGGTLNIITDPAAQVRGGSVKSEYGSWGFKKTTVSLNSGLVNDKFAFSGTLVRKTGDGFYEGTYTDAWAYYFGASYKASDKDRFEFFAIGAPQRHGQNLYKQNIGTYSHDFASGLSDYDPAAMDKFLEQGRGFNQNWAPVSPTYRGKQYYDMYQKYDRVSRSGANFILERENFFHKPQVNLNWYHTFNKKAQWATIAYWSGGRGGGAGTYGSVYRRDALGNLGDDNYKFYYGPSPWTWDWDATIAVNQADSGTYYVDKKAITKEDGQSIGILRSSRNNQYTIGAISKLYYDISDNLKTVIGIDWRTAQIEHYREVRDLLGGQYFIYKGNDFDTDPASWKKGLGDRVAYNFTNTVDWLGAYAQAQYTTEKLSLFGMVGWNTIKYGHTNHFINARDDGDPTTEANANGELVAKSPSLAGYQAKGGVMYKVSTRISFFANGGYVSKTPIFDGVISDRNGTVYDNPQNEKFTSIEIGMDGQFADGKLSTKINYYNTTWKDRTQVRGITLQDGSDGFIYLRGMNSNHSGLEIEGAWKPCNSFRLDAAASFGNWKLTDDVTGSYTTYEIDSVGNATAKTESYNYYVKDLKVGDAPQTQLALSPSFYPAKGFMLQFVYRYYANNYANWDPFSRTDETDRAQSWKAPNYGVVDFHTRYSLPLGVKGMKAEVFAHVFNLLNNVFIQDATDNSRYNAFDKDHDADDAEVFFGMPRSANAGFRITF